MFYLNNLQHCDKLQKGKKNHGKIVITNVQRKKHLIKLKIRSNLINYWSKRHIGQYGCCLSVRRSWVQDPVWTAGLSVWSLCMFSPGTQVSSNSPKTCVFMLPQASLEKVCDPTDFCLIK